MTPQFNPNIQVLSENLGGLSALELDGLLDKRCDPAFEEEFLINFEKYFRPDSRYPESKSAFNVLSEATRQHEIVDYIADDLDAIYCYRCSGDSNPYMNTMAESYESGEFYLRCMNGVSPIG